MFLAAVAGLLCLSRPALPQVNGVKVADGATALVIGGTSPMVKVTDADGNELATIPIEANPGRFIYSESANTLYVLHNEKKYEHFISAVNLTTRRVDKEIKVGAGVEVGLLVSNGGRRLFCYTAEKGLSVAGDREKWLQPHFEPAVSAIDTASNEIIATYNWIDSFRATVHEKRWFFSSQLIAGTDKGILIVTSKAFWLSNPKPKPLSEQLVIFSGQSSHPASMIDLGREVSASIFSRDKKLLFLAVDRGEKADGSLVVVDLEKGTTVVHALAGREVSASMFSRDEKLLFLAVDRGEKTDGSLVVVDLEKGTTVVHALADRATSFFRLGSTQEPWLLGNKEMRSLSEDGEPGDRRIPLNKPRKGEEGDADDASAFLDGFPGETISLGEDHAAIQINNKSGGSRHKVALIDLKKLQVEAIIPTMSTGEIAGIRAGRFAAAFGLSMATGGVLVFIPRGIRNESLAARPDGRFLFVLDLEGHEVTAVDVATATVVKRIAVNKSVTKLQISSDGKHLICLGKQTQQINLESNNLEN